MEFSYNYFNVPNYIGKNHEELFSSSKKSERPSLFILGDSRAEAGIIPELLDDNTPYNAYNIGLDGVYKGYYYGLVDNNVRPNKLIIAVSPHSIFNNFKIDKNESLRKLKNKLIWFKNPNLKSEEYFSKLINRSTHFHYGFSAVLDLYSYNKVSDFYTEKGWHGYDRLGSDQFYTYMINLESYKYKMLEEYKDPNKVAAGKSNFENLLEDLYKNQYSVLFVRIPTSSKIRNIEESKYPWFSDYIKRSVEKYDFEFKDFKDFKYPEEQVDGSHLNRKSANDFTYELLEYLK